MIQQPLIQRRTLWNEQPSESVSWTAATHQPRDRGSRQTGFALLHLPPPSRGTNAEMPLAIGSHVTRVRIFAKGKDTGTRENGRFESSRPSSPKNKPPGASQADLRMTPSLLHHARFTCDRTSYTITFTDLFCLRHGLHHRLTFMI